MYTLKIEVHVYMEELNNIRKTNLKIGTMIEELENLSVVINKQMRDIYDHTRAH